MVWRGVVWGEGNSIELSGSVPYFVLGPSKILLVCDDDDDVKCISFFFSNWVLAM